MALLCEFFYDDNGLQVSKAFLSKLKRLLYFRPYHHIVPQLGEVRKNKKRGEVLSSLHGFPTSLFAVG
jgi:hypothetical protein